MSISQASDFNYWYNYHMFNNIWKTTKTIVLIILQLQFYIFVVSYLLITFFKPSFQNSEWIVTAPYLLALQFILIHSGGFMGAFFLNRGETEKKLSTGAWFILLLVYSLFASALFIPSHNLHLLAAFFSHMFSRFINQIVLPQKEFSVSLLIDAGVGSFLLLFWLFIIFVMEIPLPRFELMQAVIAELGTKHHLEPNTIRSFYWTICYFTSMGLFNLVYLLYLDKKIKSVAK